MFGVAIRQASLRSKIRFGSKTVNVNFCRFLSIPCDDQIKTDDGKSSKLKIKSTSTSPKIDSSTTIMDQSPEDYASSAEKRAMHVTKVGAVANMALAISKGTVGFAISSTGLIADAANSLGDLLSDAVVYYSVTEARKRATPDRPWGRGKIEPLGALSVGGLLLLTGFGIGYAAILAVIEAAAISNMVSSHVVELVQSGDYVQLIAETLSNASNGAANATNGASLPGGAEGAGAGLPNGEGDGQAPKLVALINPQSSDLNHYAALGISGLSIGAKELLFRYTLKAGKAAHSDAVIANAWQHRADVSTSAAVFVGLIGSMMGYPLLDPLAGLLVAGLIVRQGGLTMVDALRDLSDAPASATETERLKQTCLSVSGVVSVEEIKARKSGPYLYVEVTIDVDGSISASAAHRIAELTRQELLKRHNPRVANAVVDMNPLGSAGLGENSPHWARDHDYIVDEIKKAAISVEEVISVSEVQLYYKDNGEIASKLDIVLHPQLTIKQAHSIAVKTRKAIEKVLPGMGEIDVDLELDETDLRKTSPSPPISTSTSSTSTSSTSSSQESDKYGEKKIYTDKEKR